MSNNNRERDNIDALLQEASSQRISPDECGQPPFDSEEEIEDVEDPRCPPAPRKPSVSFARKEPYHSKKRVLQDEPSSSGEEIFDEEDLDMDDNPDLATYFDGYELDAFAQIAMCRTYANYLSAMMRGKKPSQK